MSVSVTVNEGDQIRYIDTPSTYDLIHTLLFTGEGRASEQVLTEAGEWRLCFAVRLEGVRPNALELDQFLAAQLAEPNPTIVRPV